MEATNPGSKKTNPKVRTVPVKRPRPLQASYVPALLSGLGVTLKHFVKNVTRVNHEIQTVQYPEEKLEYPPRNRGLHRLMKRDDGTVRCVACMCCPTACPAHCITIIPAETDNEGVEKYPAVFEIDELRCVVCGLCVEVCPCDAIRMDTGKHASSVDARNKGVINKEEMLAMGSLSVATQGGKGDAWRQKEGDIPYQPRQRELDKLNKK